MAEEKPKFLYHGSEHLIKGPLRPVLAGGPDHLSETASIFATESAALASLFMLPNALLCSLGYEQGIPYMCVWGESQEAFSKDTGGCLYMLPSDSFQKVGKEYEWQSFEPVVPAKRHQYPSALEGMIQFAVQVYCISDNAVFDRIVADKDNRAPILRELESENQKRQLNVRNFT